MVYLFLGPGFEEIEAVTPLDLLRRGGVEVATVGILGRQVVGSHQIPVTADLTLEEVDLERSEMLIVPGGRGGVASLLSCPEALALLKAGWERGCFLAALCAGPTVLASLGITEGKRAVCYPGFEDRMGAAQIDPGAACVRDGKLITAASAGCAVPFGLALVAALKGEAAAQAVARQIVLR